ncbi:hypothetical protein [Haliea sp.]|uniref:hypothetical protein n=1 Tax=Haliea sp. TaxID=1932666 RepID=UPI003529360E
MKVVNNSEQELEILVELPRFILWFMLGPIGGFGALFTLALFLGGEIINGLVSGSIIAVVVLVGRYFLTQRTHLRLSAADHKVQMIKTSMLERKVFEFDLDQLDGADVELNRNHGGDKGNSRPTSGLNLLFSNTRPVTRVPVSNWSISGDGAGMLADAINDWLRRYREGKDSVGNQRQDTGGQA